MCAELKGYHYEIVATIETKEAATREQEFFDEHQCKTMEVVDRLGDLLAKPQPSVPTTTSTNDRLVDRQLDLLIWYKPSRKRSKTLTSYIRIY